MNRLLLYWMNDPDAGEKFDRYSQEVLGVVMDQKTEDQVKAQGHSEAQTKQALLSDIEKNLQGTAGLKATPAQDRFKDILAKVDNAIQAELPVISQLAPSQLDAVAKLIASIIHTIDQSVNPAPGTAPSAASANPPGK